MDELSRRDRGRLWLRLGLRLGLTALAVLAVWKVVLPLMGLLLPFVLAFGAAWCLNRPIRFLQSRLGASRGALSLALVALILALALGLAGLLVWSLVRQAGSLIQNWQAVWADALERIRGAAEALENLLRPLPGGAYEGASRALERGVSWLADRVPGMLEGLAEGAGSFAMSLPGAAIGAVVFVMAVYFLSADFPRLRARTGAHIPPELRGFCSKVKRVTAAAFGGYVRAQLLLSGGVFLILLAGFLVMGEPYALVLAALLGVMDFIPIIGAGTAMVPWAAVELILGDWGHALGLLAVWGAVALFRQVAEPRVVAGRMGLSPLLSLMSVYVGMRLGGIWGMVLGPVVCLVAVSLLRGGALDNTARDLRLALRDLGAILSGGENSKTV